MSRIEQVLLRVGTRKINFSANLAFFSGKKNILNFFRSVLLRPVFQDYGETGKAPLITPYPTLMNFRGRFSVVDSW
jgi:hypothetical protein